MKKIFSVENRLGPSPNLAAIEEVKYAALSVIMSKENSEYTAVTQRSLQEPQEYNTQVNFLYVYLIIFKDIM